MNDTPISKIRPIQPFWLWGMVALLLAVVGMTVYHLDAEPYWVDEVISIQRAGLTTYQSDSSPQAVWNRTAQVSDQVPGYYMLLAGWSNLTGATTYSGRYLSLLLGLLCLSLVFQLGKQMTRPLAGGVAAVALASSAFYAIFLHEMRTYSLLLCLVTCMLWCYWLIVYHEQRQLWTQVTLVASVTLMLYSYYLSIVVIATLCLYHLLFVAKTREWWRIVVLMGIAGALFLPWFLTSVSIFQDTERNFIRQSVTLDYSQTIANIANAFSNANNALLALLLLFSLRLRDRAHRLVWFMLLVSLALLIFLNTQLGVLANLRYTLMLWIPLALLVGMGVTRLVRMGIPASPIIGILFLAGLFSTPDPNLSDTYNLPIRFLPWDHITEITDRHEQPDDVLTFIVSIEGNDWEGAHEEIVMPHFFYDSEVEPHFIEDVRNLPDEVFLQEIEQITQNAPRVWFSYPEKLVSWRNGMARTNLRDRGFANCGTFADSDELHMDLYAHPRATENAPTLAFGTSDAAESMAQLTPLQPLPDQVDDTITLVHSWQQGAEFPRHTYSLAVHVLDANDNLIQQADYGLPEDAFACVTTRLDVQTLPPGTYRLRGFVYNWQTGDRLLPIQAAPDDTTSDDSTILGTFRVR